MSSECNADEFADRYSHQIVNALLSTRAIPVVDLSKVSGDYYVPVAFQVCGPVAAVLALTPSNSSTSGVDLECEIARFSESDGEWAICAGGGSSWPATLEESEEGLPLGSRGQVILGQVIVSVDNLVVEAVYGVSASGLAMLHPPFDDVPAQRFGAFVAMKGVQ